MYLVILAFDNLNFRQWAVRYKAIRHIFLSLREDPPGFLKGGFGLILAGVPYDTYIQTYHLYEIPLVINSSPRGNFLDEGKSCNIKP